MLYVGGVAAPAVTSETHWRLAGDLHWLLSLWFGGTLSAVLMTLW